MLPNSKAVAPPYVVAQGLLSFKNLILQIEMVFGTQKYIMADLDQEYMRAFSNLSVERRKWSVVKNVKI